MMTRVDVSNVQIVTRGSDGAPIFQASEMTYKVDERGRLWLSMKDDKGEVFAVGMVPADRAVAFTAQLAVDLGGEIRSVS